MLDSVSWIVESSTNLCFDDIFKVASFGVASPLQGFEVLQREVRRLKHERGSETTLHIIFGVGSRI